MLSRKTIFGPLVVAGAMFIGFLTVAILASFATVDVFGLMGLMKDGKTTPSLADLLMRTDGLAFLAIIFGVVKNEEEHADTAGDESSWLV